MRLRKQDVRKEKKTVIIFDTEGKQELDMFYRMGTSELISCCLQLHTLLRFLEEQG